MVLYYAHASFLCKDALIESYMRVAVSSTTVTIAWRSVPSRTLFVSTCVVSPIADSLIFGAYLRCPRAIGRLTVQKSAHLERSINRQKMYYGPPHMFCVAPLPQEARRNEGTPEASNEDVLRVVAERLDDPNFHRRALQDAEGALDPNVYAGQQSAYGADEHKGFNAKLYKTQLCKTYMGYGECPFDEKCQFAHGEADLRTPVVRNPKYKTVICRNYAANRYCPYNGRCEYIHEETPEQIEALHAGMSVAASNARSEADDPYVGDTSDASASAAPHASGADGRQAAANDGQRPDASASERAQLLEHVAANVANSPKEQRWEPAQRTGCVGVIWTKRSYQYLVYSPDLNGCEALIQIVGRTRPMNVGQWLRFDAARWKADARYTVGRYTPIDAVIHAMPILDSIIITCDVHVVMNNNEEPPLVESDYFGRVEDPHSLAARLHPGVYSVNLVYSNEEKGAATGRWTLGFVNDDDV